MADWIQRIVTRNLTGTSPSRWFKAYSCIHADPVTGLVYVYNGTHDSALANVDIYDNALLELTAPASVTTATENQRNRSNWNYGASGNNIVQLAADLTTPTMPDRHSTFAYDRLNGYLYFFIGLSTNMTITRAITSGVDAANDWIDFADNVTPLCTGDIVRWTTTGTLPGGLATATSYWVRRHSSTRLSFHTSYAHAKANTGIVNLTDNGSGTHTMSRQTNSSGVGNHPSDTWRVKVSSGAGQYVWEQLFPTGIQPIHVPAQIAPTPAAIWFPEGCIRPGGSVAEPCFVLMGLNTDGFTVGNRTTWLYWPPDGSNPGGEYERLSAYTNNNGGPQPGHPQCMAHDPITDSGCVWFFGGEGAGNALWKFKSDKTWTQITPANTPPSTRVNHGFCYGNGKLWLQGGESTDGGTNRNDFWSYDPVTNEWTQDTVAILPTSANFTYMSFDGTHLVVMNNALEVWTNEIPSGGGGGQSLLGAPLITEEIVRSGSITTAISLAGYAIQTEESCRPGVIQALYSLLGSNIRTEEIQRPGSIAVGAVTLLGAYAQSEERVNSGVIQTLVLLAGGYIPTEERTNAGTVASLFTILGHYTRTEERVNSGTLSTLIGLLGDTIRTEEKLNAGSVSFVLSLLGQFIQSEEAVRSGALSATITLLGVHIQTNETVRAGTLASLLTLGGSNIRTEELLRAGAVTAGAVTLNGDYLRTEERFNLHSLALGLVSLGGTAIPTEEHVNLNAIDFGKIISGSFIATEERVRSGNITPGAITITGFHIATNERVHQATLAVLYNLLGQHILTEEKFYQAALSLGTVTVGGSNIRTEERILGNAIHAAISLSGTNIQTEEKTYAAILSSICQLQGVYIPSEEKVQINLVVLSEDVTLFGVYIRTNEKIQVGLIIGGEIFGLSEIIEANSEFDYMLEANSEFESVLEADSEFVR